MSYIKESVSKIKSYIKKKQLIILESTIYPGATEEFFIPILREKKLELGKDIFLAYSPEREDPGNINFTIAKGNIPKIISGSSPNCLELTKTLYSSITKTVKVSSIKTAEFTKLLENVYRSINIGFVNEMKLIANKMGINIHESIKAAKTKPFGFMPFYPGPGIGGHCIPIDPFYLSWKAKEYNTEAKFIELAGEINRKMAENIAHRIGKALNDDGKSVKGSKIMILGIAYKKDIDDVRESPALRIMKLLNFKGAEICYHDPYVNEVNGKTSTKLNSSNIKKQDALIITTDHSDVDYETIGKYAKLIIDTRNIMAKVKNPNARVLRA